MKKRFIFSAVGLLGASVMATYLVRNRSNKYNEEASTLEHAGLPDQLKKQDHAQLENAKMVSEGSQYGVQYYNHVQEEEAENH